MTVDEALKYADDYLVFKEKYYDAEHVGMTYSLAAEVRRLRDERQKSAEQVEQLKKLAEWNHTFRAGYNRAIDDALAILRGEQ